MDLDVAERGYDLGFGGSKRTLRMAAETSDTSLCFGVSCAPKYESVSAPWGQNEQSNRDGEMDVVTAA